MAIDAWLKLSFSRHPGLAGGDVHNIRCTHFSKAVPVLRTIRGFRFMKEFLLTTPAQMVLWGTALLMLIAIAWYVVGRFREGIDDNQPNASQLLTNFRELHQQGDIDDAEFRTIKTVLGAKLQKELNDTDGRG